jgi:hypothetical protein
MPAGCRIASCRPLIALPSRCLVAPAVALPLAVLSLRHPLVNSSRQLVDASPLLVLLLRPASPSRPLVGWLVVASPLDTPLSRRLVSCRAASRCLIAPAGCRTIILPPSRPLIVLAGCCVACPCATLSSSRRSPSPTPSNVLHCRHSHTLYVTLFYTMIHYLTTMIHYDTL